MSAADLDSALLPSLSKDNHISLFRPFNYNRPRQPKMQLSGSTPVQVAGTHICLVLFPRFRGAAKQGDVEALGVQHVNDTRHKTSVQSRKYAIIN